MDKKPLEVGDDLFLTLRDSWYRSNGITRAKVIRVTRTQAFVGYRSHGRDFEVKFKRDSWQGFGESRQHKIEPFDPDVHDRKLTLVANRNWWNTFREKEQGDEMVAFLRGAVRERTRGERNDNGD